MKRWKESLRFRLHGKAGGMLTGNSVPPQPPQDVRVGLCSFQTTEEEAGGGEGGGTERERERQRDEEGRGRDEEGRGREREREIELYEDRSWIHQDFILSFS